jgi:hypothetical protein
MQKAEKINANGAQVDPNGKRAAVKYNFGDVTVAADYIRLAGQNITQANASATTTQAHTLTGKSAGIAYAVTPNASVGYTRSQGSTSVSGFETEKVHMFAVGYNLGAVALQAQYRDGRGIAGQAGDTGVGNVTQVMISTKF